MLPRNTKQKAKKSKHPRNKIRDSSRKTRPQRLKQQPQRETQTLHKITRELTNPGFGKTSVVKDKNGKVITREEDQRTRWAEHFKEILNRLID
ncbi:alginate biosynthesis protein AlgK [Elysia marginata]|uniref:Alginate biosynthesis protein AlgK n=1 Tax=Elysia marginata TaxID=1093978 RepID=A0AAV4JI14_9GAST|nr:alginate biosynthesis protein AlgK [Elysia marginata]